jgi:ABC-type multidrug transport system ATPase subunit
VVLITHQVQYLRTVKRIYYLQKGEIVVHGTYEELKSKGHFLKLQSTETNGAAIANVTEPVSVKQLEFPEEVKEHRSSGRIIHGYGNYCAADGKWICLAAVCMFLMVQLLGCRLDYILIFCVNSQNKILNEKSVLALNYHNQTHSKLVSDAKWADLLTTYVKVKSESRNNACASLHIRDVTILLRLSALVNATRMTTGVRLNMSK